MLDWAYVTKQRTDTIAELQRIERKAHTLRGALAAYDDLIEHAQQAAKGGSAPAAPVAVAPAPPPPSPLPAPLAGIQGVKSGIRVGHGDVQADTELQE